MMYLLYNLKIEPHQYFFFNMIFSNFHVSLKKTSFITNKITVKLRKQLFLANIIKTFKLIIHHLFMRKL